MSWIVFGIFLFYVIGIFVRRDYGLRVDVINKSGVVLGEASVELVGWKYQFGDALTDIAPGKRRRVFLRAGRKSHFTLKFTDLQGGQHTEDMDDYIRAADCSNIKVTILPSSKVDVTIPTHPVICWESWFGFL